jgi:hypothetical protein
MVERYGSSTGAMAASFATLLLKVPFLQYLNFFYLLGFEEKIWKMIPTVGDQIDR